MTSKKTIPEPKYYRKWGMPPVPSLEYPVAPRKYYSADDWSFITTERQKPELYVPPKLWNQIVHELLYTEANQKTIADKLGTKRKYVRAVVAGIGSMVQTKMKLGELGPRQAQILEQKVKKRQTQATIARALRITKQQVNASIPRLEKKFKENDEFRGLGRGGVDSYFGGKAPKPVATPDVNPVYAPNIDLETCSEFARNLQVTIKERGRRSWWSKK